MDEESVNSFPSFWDRKKLYEEVWSDPVTKVAQRYRVSDVAIAKVCRKLQIPLPGRGYWAKKEHGHTVVCTPLPELKDPPRLMKPSPVNKTKFPEHAEDQAEFERIDRLLTDGVFALKFEERMLNHPLVLAARKALGNGREDNRHVLVSSSGQPCLDIRVTKKTLDRALRIAARLIATFESNQYKVAVKSNANHSTTISRGDEDDVHFIIRERVKQLGTSSGRLASTSAYGAIEYEPTGELSIEIPEYVEVLKKKWSDTSHIQLEEVLPQSIAGILKVGVALRRRHLERKERDVREKKRQVELAELAERIKEEKKRLEQLTEMVANWRLSMDIRGFIAEAEAKNTASTSDPERKSEFVEWTRWAREQADRLDPLTSSPPSVLDREHEIPHSHFHSVAEGQYTTERDRQERMRYFWMGWWKGKRNS